MFQVFPSDAVESDKQTSKQKTIIKTYWKFLET